ncbi:MAG: ASKHA domain-containing protein [Candidatus Hodarchaeales archaeon]
MEITNLNQILHFSPNGGNLLTIIHEELEKNVISSLCKGNGKCGKCRVSISGELTGDSATSDEINPLTNIEKQLLGNTISKGVRLACQVILGNMDFKVTIFDLTEDKDNIFKIQDSYSNYQLNFPFLPRLFVQHLSVPPPTLENAQDDFLRLSKTIEESFTEPLSINNPEILSQVANTFRDKSGKIHVVIDRHTGQLIEVNKEKPQILGVVIDVGTTSIVATLVDLETGVILSADSIINPQIEFGRDIMSRLTHALVSPLKQQQLQNKALNGISELLTSLTSSTDSSPTNIFEIIVVGNSAMHHLFLNLPVNGLSRSPFVPVISKELLFFIKDIDKEQKLDIRPNTIITMPPLIGGFIGSDAVVDILYTGFNQKEGTHLLIDFGTNSEIILLKDNNLFAASVAAGGAFEGQHIACGMRGVTGAIEKFKILDGNYQYQTINSNKPEGICGTGIIDILAELLINGQLDYRGRLSTVSGELLKKLILVQDQETSTNQAIYLTRKDVEAIQKAKAATLAAIRTLTTHLSINIEEIDSVNIAGVFGSKLDITNAKTIGLLPNLPNNRFIIQGNTAEKGGRTFLLSIDARKTANIIATKVKRLELAKFPNFQSFFTEGLFFPRNVEKEGTKGT